MLVFVEKSEKVRDEFRICTLGVQSQVLGPIWTLKHLRIPDLLQQQLQEVLSGCLATQVAAGKRGLLDVFEAEQRCDHE